MAVRTVRIYSGESDSNIIGFSGTVSFESGEGEPLQMFLSENSYSRREVARPVGSLSAKHLEVRPPLSDEHAQEFGELCIAAFGDNGNHNVVVVDNREQLPREDGAVLASG